MEVSSVFVFPPKFAVSLGGERNRATVWRRGAVAGHPSAEASDSREYAFARLQPSQLQLRINQFLRQSFDDFGTCQVPISIAIFDLII